MSRITFRPTVSSDLSAVIGEPLPFRIRAITVLDGDKVLGIGGIGFTPDGRVIAFVQQSEEAKRYPIAFHRAGLMAMRMIEESSVAEVLSSADKDNPKALQWLERLGFVRAGDIENNRALFVWRRTCDGIPPPD